MARRLAMAALHRCVERQPCGAVQDVVDVRAAEPGQFRQRALLTAWQGRHAEKRFQFRFAIAVDGLGEPRPGIGRQVQRTQQPVKVLHLPLIPAGSG
jgi:hypothetical protein